jgi:hypothetical protein
MQTEEKAVSFPTPWSVHEQGDPGDPFAKQIRVLDAERNAVAVFLQQARDGDRYRVVCERIVACVNACQGLPDYLLEAGPLKPFVVAGGVALECDKEETP